MKKITGYIAAALIACMTLSSCQDFSLDTVLSFAGSIFGWDDDDEDDSDSNDKTGSHFLFNVVNNSDEDIYWYVPEFSTVPSIGKNCNEKFLHKVRKGKTQAYSILYGDEDPIWTYGVDDRMPVYFIKVSTYNDNDWDEIVANKMWEDHYVLSPEDIVLMDKTITFPRN